MLKFTLWLLAILCTFFLTSCADNPVVSPPKSIIHTDPNGNPIYPNGAAKYPDKKIYYPDGTVYCPDQHAYYTFTKDMR